LFPITTDAASGVPLLYVKSLYVITTLLLLDTAALLRLDDSMLIAALENIVFLLIVQESKVANIEVEEGWIISRPPMF
jgi:hypothetical protein